MQTLENSPFVDDVAPSIEAADDAGFTIKKTQEIPEWHLAALKAEKDESADRPMGEYHRVCSVPVAVIEQWASEGFDFYKESPRAILNRLRAEHLDAFITTKHQIF